MDHSHNITAEPMPNFPVNSLTAAILLFVTGMSFIFFGVVELLSNGDSTTGATLWIIGALVGIPGTICTIRLSKALNSDSPLERIRLLKGLPNI
jgi:hypothetical protein